MRKIFLEDTPKTPEMIRKFIDENYHRNIKAEEIGKYIGMNQNVNQERIQRPDIIQRLLHYISELRMFESQETDHK
jgi:hypothetical protein